jgi:hypothetical protein
VARRSGDHGLGDPAAFVEARSKARKANLKRAQDALLEALLVARAAHTPVYLDDPDLRGLVDNYYRARCELGGVE